MTSDAAAYCAVGGFAAGKDSYQHDLIGLLILFLYFSAATIWTLTLVFKELFTKTSIGSCIPNT